MSYVRVVTMTAAGALLAGTGAFAQVQQITCESTENKYRYCAAKTDNEVRMLRQISSERCEQGKSWGYDKEGVWVDMNCAAEFRVGRSGPSTSQKLAAGAAAGAAVLQAMLGGQQATAAGPAAPAAASSELSPSLVGTFSAVHPKSGENYYVTIDAQGVVDGRVKDRQFFGRVKGQQIFVGAAAFPFRQEGDGFLVYETGKESDGVHFAKVQ
jgi:hypothetical protein